MKICHLIYNNILIFQIKYDKITPIPRPTHIPHFTLSTKCADIRNNVAIIGGILFLPFNFKKIDIRTSIDKISNPRNKFLGILNGANENIKNNITSKYF